MRDTVGLVVAVIIGIGLGFFGVFNSVFSDAGIAERLLVIAVILLIYLALGGLWGFFFPGRPWRWVLAFSLPGVIFLALYMLGEFNIYYVLYIILLLALTGAGAYSGSRLRTHR